MASAQKTYLDKARYPLLRLLNYIREHKTDYFLGIFYSVTNKFCQLHDADNVFVADAGTFVSQADKNPTWTIMALSWRMSDYIVDQMKQRNL